jgi:hypothetical protein
MDKIMAAKIISEVELAGNSGILGLQQKHQTILTAGFRFCLGCNGLLPMPWSHLSADY